MPFPIVPLIGAGVSLFDSIFNSSSTNSTNQASMQFQKDMYSQQRADALSDRDYANKYNSPKETMARYTEAGLNKNLIYGMSAQPSTPVRSASAEAPKINAPQINSQGIVNALMQFYEVQKTQAQTDNLKAQIDAMKTKMQLDQANTSGRIQDTKFKAEMQDYNLEHLQSSNRLLDKQAYESDSRRSKIDADTQYTLHQDARSAARTNSDLKTAVIDRLNKLVEREKNSTAIAVMKQTITNMRAGRDNMVWDNQLKQLEAEWNGLRNNRGYFDPNDQEQIKAMSHVLQAATIGILSRK